MSEFRLTDSDPLLYECGNKCDCAVCEDIAMRDKEIAHLRLVLAAISIYPQYPEAQLILEDALDGKR